MSRAAVMIRNDSDREHAARLAWKMPNGGSVEFRQARRSLSQNSKLWAMVTEVSEQVDWYGQNSSRRTGRISSPLRCVRPGSCLE